MRSTCAKVNSLVFGSGAFGTGLSRYTAQTMMDPTAAKGVIKCDVEVPFRMVVVAPTYNHAVSLPRVLAELSAREIPIIAIDDGSTDASAGILREWAEGNRGKDRWMLAHTRNRGKAEALRTGFTEALRLGFSHAATIDTDGQHDVADLERVVALARLSPDALVLGAREAGAGVPAVSRVGRWVSNLLVQIESGVRVCDSQTGMRVYPLRSMASLGARASRYNFETEVLVLAGWHGVPVREYPIRCIYEVHGGRTTHFRRVRDTATAVAMHAAILASALTLGPRLAESDGSTGTITRRLARWFSLRRLKDMADGDDNSQHRLAASVGVGLLIATLPIYGVKTFMCLWAAARFRLHPLPVLVVSSLSTPPLGFVFVGLSVGVGSLLLHGRILDLSLVNLSHASRWSAVNALLTDWLVGSVVAGLAVGAAGYCVTRLLLRVRGTAVHRSAP